MKPIHFERENIVLAEDQPEYNPLPAHMNEVETVTLWSFSWGERIHVLFRGTVWVRQMNMRFPLQPQLLTTENPFEEDNHVRD